ncbi:MAG: cytosolic protein [Spirochaetes bacterium GWF1_49_6]|nr:MAG: cytosolic protein [Spirochaetes bacterium GWF1_49_6]
MNNLLLEQITLFVNDNIIRFHIKRIEALKTLKLLDVLKRKNPYLFRAKNILTSQDLIENILDAYLSSKEETLFGDFLEQLAIFICKNVFDGKKSAAKGIDLEFERNGNYYIVSIKSGPNWGNSGQIDNLKSTFRQAKRILMTNNGMKKPIIAVNGCCYGKEGSPDKIEYFKYCGQEFWELISGESHLYVDIIEPLGYQAKQKNEQFYESYAAVINEFSYQFTKDFCSHGKIDWENLIKFNSGRQK